MKKKLQRGGDDTERLYLQNLDFRMQDGTQVSVKKTHYPDFEMKDLVARHHARYGLLGLYCRPGKKLLDFPAGSGYGAIVLAPLGISYEGKDFDPATVEYARRIYGQYGDFSVGDLTKPRLPVSEYDIIGCIEGLEHIEEKYQQPLITEFFKALKPGGVLIISSPENPTGKSGKSMHNPHHKHELTKKDFLTLLNSAFGTGNVEHITQQATLSTGVTTTCVYGICHKI